MEIIPSYVVASPGTIVTFKCKYNSKGQDYNIQVLEDGTQVWKSSDKFYAYEFGAEKTWQMTVGCQPVVVECVVKNKENFVVGLITARVYPGLPN